MRSKIEDFLELKEKLITELKEYVIDKNISLQERWEVFIMSELGEDYPFIIRFDSPYFNEFLDNSYRHQTVELELMVENLVDRLITKENVDDIEDLSKESLQKIYDLQELILKNFLHSFKVDW